jgi:hypothetical protein
MVIMSPVALYARIFGGHDGFVLARIVSAVVTALNASFLAVLVRHRGRVAMVVAGAGLALLPVAIFVSSGLRLEPYCVCFILIGSLVVFSHDTAGLATSNRRLLVGGVLLGVAVLVKLWAVFPLVALIVCLVPRYRRRALLPLAAAVTTFAVVSLPFFVSAPRNFLSQVFVEQLSRKADAVTGAQSVIGRLMDMTGFSSTTIAPNGAVVVVSFVVFVLLVAAAFARRLEREAFDVYWLLATVITVTGLLAAPEYLNYYGYFAAPFLLGLLGLSLGRLGPSIGPVVQRLRLSKEVRRIIVAVSSLALAVLLFALVLFSTTFYSKAARFGIAQTAISPISNYVPKGSCVCWRAIPAAPRSSTPVACGTPGATIWCHRRRPSWHSGRPTSRRSTTSCPWPPCPVLSRPTSTPGRTPSSPGTGHS